MNWTDTETNCEITGHLLNWAGDVLWNDSKSDSMVFLDESLDSYCLTDTIPYTNYSVCIVTQTSNIILGPSTCQTNLVTSETGQLSFLWGFTLLKDFFMLKNACFKYILTFFDRMIYLNLRTSTLI